MPNIILKIDCTKLKKEWLFKGQKGTYADLVLYDNEGLDEYGNSHSIKQNPPKEARDRGEKGVYVGNGKWMQRQQEQRPPVKKKEPRDTRPIHEQGESSIPF